MGFGSVYEEFLALEDELGVFAIEVDGVPVWERVRFEVIHAIMTERGTWSQAHSTVDKSLPNLLEGAGLWLRNLVSRNPFLADEHAVLFWGHERRKRQDDGLWWDLYCDPIHEALDLDYLHVEKPHLNEHLRPAKTANLRYLDLIEYSSTVLRVLGLDRTRVPATQQRRLERVGERLRETFDVEIEVVDRVRFRLALRRTLKPMYERFLRQVDPELVVVVVSNQKETFVEACQDRGVPVVELQHGVLTRYEYGYPGDRTKVTFPDYFFTFGPYWNDRAELPIPDENVRAVGYAHFDQQRSRLANDPDTDGLVFISQGNVGADLSRVAVELSRQPSVDPDDVVYKLHPGEYERWREDYPWLADAGLRVIGEAGPDLYDVFADVSAQVGVYSTAVYEGLGFGLRTFLYDLPGVEELDDLRASGHARLVASPDELASHLNSPGSTPVDSATFFAPHPIRNFREAVRDIADEENLDIELGGPVGDSPSGSR